MSIHYSISIVDAIKKNYVAQREYKSQLYGSASGCIGYQVFIENTQFWITITK